MHPEDAGDDALLEFPRHEDTRALLSLAGAVLAEGGIHAVGQRQAGLVGRYADRAGFRLSTSMASDGFGAFVDDAVRGWFPGMTAEELMVQFTAWVHAESSEEGATWEDYGWQPPQRRQDWLHERMGLLKMALDEDFVADHARENA